MCVKELLQRTNQTLEIRGSETGWVLLAVRFWRWSLPVAGW
jgi:hypothetical protein